MCRWPGRSDFLFGVQIVKCVFQKQSGREQSSSAFCEERQGLGGRCARSG